MRKNSCWFRKGMKVITVLEKVISKKEKWRLKNVRLRQAKMNYDTPFSVFIKDTGLRLIIPYDGSLFTALIGHAIS